MKTAICYHSQHHGNTRKLIQAMTQGLEVDLIDITAPGPGDLSGYDLVGFASGIYGFEFSPKAVEYLKAHLPQGKPVFFVYTYGGLKGTGTRAIAQAAREKSAPCLGEFGCRGYVTYGPFRLLGGVGKGRPGPEEFAQARQFFHDILSKAGQQS